MELITNLEPGIFNAAKFIAEYLWVDYFMYWLRGKLRRAANVRQLIHGQPVPISNVFDRPTYSNILSSWRRKVAKEDEKGEARAKPADEESTIIQQFDTDRDETKPPPPKLWMKRICRFFLYILPTITLLGLLLMEYATDTVAKCKNKAVSLGNAETNIGVLVAAFSCGMIQQTPTDDRTRSGFTVYQVGYTDSFMQGNQIVCGCSDWKTENCVSEYNNSVVSPPSNAIWRSSVKQSRRDAIELLEKIRFEVGMTHAIQWLPLRDTTLRRFHMLNGGFLACFHSAPLASGTRVIACIYQVERIRRFADVIFITQSSVSNSVSLVYYSMPFKTGVAFEPLLYGILDGPRHIYRGIPIIYYAESNHLSRIESLRIVAAALKMLVHFDIRYVASSENEAYVLSHAIVLMLSVNTRLHPSGTGKWKTCKGNVMIISPLGSISSLVTAAFTILSIIVAVITSPEKAICLLYRGRALESSRWAVNSMISEKFGGTSCLSGGDIDADVILTNEKGFLHITIVPRGGKSLSCKPEDIPSIKGRPGHSRKHLKKD